MSNYILHLIQSFSTLNTQDMKFNSQKLSLTPVSFFSSNVRAKVLGTLCKTGMMSPLLSLPAFAFFLMMLSHTGDKLYLPPSLLKLQFRALIYIASFIPLSNHLSSVVSISVFSYSYDKLFDLMCIIVAQCVYFFIWCILLLVHNILKNDI